MQSDTFTARLKAGTREFKHIEIADIDLSNGEYPDLRFTGCTFVNVDFSGSMLEGLHATDCRFFRCRFISTNLDDAVFKQTTFYRLDEDCNFARATVRFSKWQECDVRLCSFQYAKLLRTQFDRVNAMGANFYRADFAGAMTMKQCNLRMADLRDADLRECVLSKTIFEQANLQEANLTEADVTGCDFAGANLRFTKLRGVDARGANTGEFDIHTMDLTGVKLYKTQAKNLLEKAGLLLFPDP